MRVCEKSSTFAPDFNLTKMKVFKIAFFFLLSTMLFASCNKAVEQQVTKMDNADREFLDRVNQVLIAKIAVGTPKQTVDSILLACGFQYYGQRPFGYIYAYNAPSSVFPLWPYFSMVPYYDVIEPILYDAGIYTSNMDSIDSVFDRQYRDSVYKKGRIYAYARPEYDESQGLKRLFFSVKMHPLFEEKRYVSELLSNAIYQKFYDQFESEASSNWHASAYYCHADGNYRNPDKKYYGYSDDQLKQRPSYLDFMAEDECYIAIEYIDLHKSELDVYCSCTFRFYNNDNYDDEEYSYFKTLFNNVASFGFNYEGQLYNSEY